LSEVIKLSQFIKPLLSWNNLKVFWIDSKVSLLISGLYLRNVLQHFAKNMEFFHQNERMRDDRWKRELKKKEDETHFLQEERKKVNTFKSVKREMNDGLLSIKIDAAISRPKFVLLVLLVSQSSFFVLELEDHQ